MGACPMRRRAVRPLWLEWSEPGAEWEEMRSQRRQQRVRVFSATIKTLPLPE